MSNLQMENEESVVPIASTCEENECPVQNAVPLTLWNIARNSLYTTYKGDAQVYAYLISLYAKRGPFGLSAEIQDSTEYGDDDMNDYGSENEYVEEGKELNLPQNTGIQMDAVTVNQLSDSSLDVNRKDESVKSKSDTETDQSDAQSCTSFSSGYEER